MSKLKTEDQFLDLSDYGRSFGRFLAKSLQHTRFTPIHVTLLFGVCGLFAIVAMLEGYYILAAFLLLLKSGIDAADGELARLKKTPSYSGRYLDSIFDFILNFLFLSTVTYITNVDYWLLFVAFFGLQLQGTLYNYYYVILRNRSVGGDSTSKIFEYKTPKALPGERQKTVNILFQFYLIFYGIFDKIIYFLDGSASKVRKFPNWFMTMLSVYGLGFQLFIMAALLALNQIDLILNVFTLMTFPVLLCIIVRKIFIK
ncbi:CDP-alcohol phosphatidyltransferase family protein [Flavobacterium antarcticum]|uniref:CDP-alcohol phosphatidyltransferase family protein n=1 Tax=Flavobacterium antarcticum TaxID=271155 RepID=UPI0003B33F6B|nr:CDP-alcohol phosphatidyltransferase family protein [Flavobacterium antarcticum]